MWQSSSTGEARTMLSSSVQTRRAQTLTDPPAASLPSSATSSSTPSHQHLRAGLRQKRSSFWAVTIWAESSVTLGRPPLVAALAFGSSSSSSSAWWTMPVLSRTSAIDEMEQRAGSRSRWPQVSSRSKPLLGSQRVKDARRSQPEVFDRRVRARVNGGRTTCRACRSGAARRHCSPC
jgi:hypothetical protein